jgi:A/G-specific adenine glycosylase
VITAPVLGWGIAQLRDLPWRATRDPWAVLVSEVMLQQTQVVRVVPRWSRFLERFPDPAACAASGLGDVLREWQGLGYPRRAKQLHATAGRIVELGRFPRDLAGLLALPGVGQYTARALMAFAFELDAAVVDTNVARVYARLEGRKLTRNEVQAIADAACPPGSAWAWNQSMLDLGATICRPVPQCDRCPIRQHCAWAGDGPDPAEGSSGVSRTQSAFAGSDRQARGRLMRAITEAPVPRDRVHAVMQRDAVTAARLVEALVAEGFCTTAGDVVRLAD